MDGKGVCVCALIHRKAVRLLVSQVCTTEAVCLGVLVGGASPGGEGGGWAVPKPSPPFATV